MVSGASPAPEMLCILILTGWRGLSRRGKRGLQEAAAALLRLAKLMGGVRSPSAISRRRRVIRLSAAQPAGAVDFPLGQAARGSALPPLHKALASQAEKELFLAADDAPALLSIVASFSVQFASLPDSLGSLQESSRKWALLQAACLPKDRNAAHPFLPLRF